MIFLWYFYRKMIYKKSFYYLTNLKYRYKILRKAMTERSTADYRSQRAGDGEILVK